MRVILDTNLLVSALLSPTGTPGQIVNLWRTGVFEIWVSTETYDELARVIMYPKIRKAAGFSEKDCREFLALLQDRALYQGDIPHIAPLQDDPTDTKFIELALASAADFIVSGDRHLLRLGSYQGIPILSPREFLNSLPATEDE